MTVLEASNKLFEWFSENQKFNFDEDMENLMPNAQKGDKAAIKCALEEFDKLDIVKGTEIKSDYYWVLNKNFESFGQDVKISPKTAMMISQLLNSFCEVLNVKDDESDPKEISEHDINNLLLICYHFINEAGGEEPDPSRN
jgi:hypothetical protein